MALPASYSRRKCQRQTECMNIFQALEHSHQAQRAMADRLVADDVDGGERQSLFEQLRVELAAHAAAEERCFYVPLIAHDLTQEPSRHGIAEHHQMDKLVESLEALSPAAPEWLVTAKALHHKIYHHLADEEEDVFEMAKKVLTDEQVELLGQDYSGEFEAQREKV